MAKYKNNTKQVSRKGYICKVDSADPSAFVTCTYNETNCLGVVTEAVPYRAPCEIQTSGAALVFVGDNVNQGDVIRLYKNTDHVSTGSCRVARDGDAPYLRIGVATKSGKGLVPVSLSFSYLYGEDVDEISWNNIGNPPTRVVTDTTTELVIDYTIICNKATAMTVNLLAATGSNRVRVISNIGAGEVTVNPSGVETIDNETTQPVYTDNTMVIQDYASGKFKII